VEQTRFEKKQVPIPALLTRFAYPLCLPALQKNISFRSTPTIFTVPEGPGKYYRMKYEGNDQEELNHTEVGKYKKKNRREGRMTREVGQRMRLRIKLGGWNIPANESERMWPFYYSHTTDILYRSYREECHQQGQFYYDCHNRKYNNTYDYTPTDNIKLLPKEAVPTDVMDTEQGWRMSGRLPMMHDEEGKEKYKQ
jgi:hypothetical protein